MAADELPNINKLWNFRKPAETRRTFETLRLDLLTQIARTHGLEGHFARAHELLDAVEKSLETVPEVVRVRYLLERGRTFHSFGQGGKADALFRQAWDLAREIEEHGYAVDAAHMPAITAGHPQGKLALEALCQELGEKNGFVQEEIGEIHRATGKPDLAQPCFRRAYRILRESYAADEQERMARLAKLAGE